MLLLYRLPQKYSMLPKRPWEVRTRGQVSARFLLSPRVTGRTVITRRVLSRIVMDIYRSGSFSRITRILRGAEIRFDTWRLVGVVNLVSHVTILYGGETWVFDFKTLNLNAVDRIAFQIPEAPRRLR